MRFVSSLAIVLVVGGLAVQVVSENQVLFLGIGILIAVLALFAGLWPRRPSRGRKDPGPNRATNEQSPNSSVPRNNRDPAKLQFHRDDDRSVTYDGKVIGFIVPNQSKLSAWAFLPVPKNGVVEQELRGRSQKDIRSVLRQSLAPTLPLAVSPRQERSAFKGGRPLTDTDPTWTPLHRAAYRGQLERVQSLIADQADVNVRNKSGETPLDVAYGDEVVATLLTAGAYRTRQWPRDRSH